MLRGRERLSEVGVSMKTVSTRKWTLASWMKNLDIVYANQLALTPRELGLIKESFGAGQSAGRTQERRRLRKRMIKALFGASGSVKSEIMGKVF